MWAPPEFKICPESRMDKEVTYIGDSCPTDFTRAEYEVLALGSQVAELLEELLEDSSIKETRGC